MEIKFDNEFFAKMVKDSQAQDVNFQEVAKEQEEVLKHSDKISLKELFNCDPKDFYAYLVNAIGSACVNKVNDSEFIKKAIKVKEDFESNLKFKPQLVVLLYRIVKFVVAKITGVIKFSWDTLVIGGAFTGRFAFRLINNIGKALIVTAYETKDDAINAGKEINKSFKTNILNK